MQRQSIFITAIGSLFILAGWIGYTVLRQNTDANPAICNYRANLK